ncbi:MAG TPA: ferrochelatase, partial [Vicinamibacteria bacterium]|nr:ferrochelatase [Vicinamibacteria bacterium]
MGAGAEGQAPVGVLLFNLGGPPDLPSVEPFLVNLFSDRDIIEL